MSDPAIAERISMTNLKSQVSNFKWLLLAMILCLVMVASAPAQTPTTQAQTTAPDFQSVIARQAALVTEFETNGLKVLVKRREGSQTVAAGLFIKGGVENTNASNAGVEAFML